MDQINLGELPKPESRLESLSREELIEKYAVIESELGRVIRENYQLRKLKISDDQLHLIMQEQLAEQRATMFGASSERYKKSEKEKPKGIPKPRIKKPSERYPRAGLLVCFANSADSAQKLWLNFQISTATKPILVAFNA